MRNVLLVGALPPATRRPRSGRTNMVRHCPTHGRRNGTSSRGCRCTSRAVGVEKGLSRSRSATGCWHAPSCQQPVAACSIEPTHVRRIGGTHTPQCRTRCFTLWPSLGGHTASMRDTVGYVMATPTTGGCRRTAKGWGGCGRAPPHRGRNVDEGRRCTPTPRCFQCRAVGMTRR